MTQYLYGISAFIVSMAIFNWSITQSNASLSGPNTSLGSNPIENMYGVQRLYVGNSITLLPGSSTLDFIVTKAEVTSTRCALAIDGDTVFSHYSNTLGWDSLPTSANLFQGSLKVPAGEILTLKATITSGDVDCAYYVEGYYAQP